jgi:hypothetical protein
MFRSKTPTFNVSIPRKALESIFDECDQFDLEETGGRIVGFYEKKDTHYDIQVLGVIGPGPKARRSHTSFFQDGEFQENIFRSIEQRYPGIEHLGNWHTHHVNGHPTLSGGDKATYMTTVNHSKHNTDFFYALLVVHKRPRQSSRYQIKHYCFIRNDDTTYEIPDEQVRVVDVPVVWSRDNETSLRSPTPSHHSGARAETIANPERAKDEDFFATFYPDLRPLFSRSIGAFYWKGPIDLIDGSRLNVLALETSNNGAPQYSITVDGHNSLVSEFSASQDRVFKSARHGVVTLERELNRALYHNKQKD